MLVFSFILSFWSKLNDLGLCHQTLFLVRGWSMEVRLWTATVLQGEGVISMQSLLSDGNSNHGLTRLNVTLVPKSMLEIA